jgi:hypothetical protein
LNAHKSAASAAAESAWNNLVNAFQKLKKVDSKGARFKVKSENEKTGLEIAYANVCLPDKQALKSAGFKLNDGESRFVKPASLKNLLDDIKRLRQTGELPCLVLRLSNGRKPRVQIEPLSVL